MALSTGASAIETTWLGDSAPDPYWYDNIWSDGLPTALDTAVIGRARSVNMNAVDWAVGGLKLYGGSSICGGFVDSRCGRSGDATRGATLTIAPPSLAQAAISTPFHPNYPVLVDEYLASMSARFQHMGLVSAGRVEIAPGLPLLDDRIHHLDVVMDGVNWVHSGLIEVNHGGGSGMLTLFQSTLGAVGRAPDLDVDAKRHFNPEWGSTPGGWSIPHADVFLHASTASFTDIRMRGQLGLFTSTITADTLEVGGGGRVDIGKDARLFVRTATVGMNAGNGTFETSQRAARNDSSTPLSREARSVHVDEFLALGSDAGSHGELFVGGLTDLHVGRPETTGAWGMVVLQGAQREGSSAAVEVRSGSRLFVHGYASLGVQGAAKLTVTGEMIVSHDLNLGNGSETASAQAVVEGGGLLHARNVYVGADYFELNYGDHNPYGSGTGTLTVRDGGVVRVTGDRSIPLFEGAPTFYSPGYVYVGRNDFLNGNGTIEATNPAGGGVVNLGTVSPGNSPGILTIDGDFGFTNPSGFGSSGGRLVIELGGHAPGTGYDVLHVLGDMDLDGGILELVAIDGFVPDAGDVFAFLRVEGAVTGNFATLVDHTGLGWTLDDLQFGPGGAIGLNVAAVPEPEQWALIGAGLVLMGMRLRRTRRSAGR
ncbi:MAG: hypothetical protein U1F52_18525 [Burkholderiales bacterium]